MESDAAGRVWIAEAGTAKNDGRISILHNNAAVPAITGFNSQIYLGDVDGLSHMLCADGVLYILYSNEKLYKADVGAFKPGDAPLLASSIPSEDIGAFVKAQTAAGIVTDNPDKYSHAYQMVIGPGGDLFIVDAAANVIIRCNKTTGALSILASIPGVKNPTPVGPPFIQGVPTGIVFDGTNFLVSGLMGFPFPAGTAQICQVTPAGVVSVYQAGFNSMTGIDLNNGPIVLEYGTFGPMGWIANSGRLVRANKPGTTVLVSGLNKPAALEQITVSSYFVVSLGNNSLQKVTF